MSRTINEPKETYSIVQKGYKIKPKLSNADYFLDGIRTKNNSIH